MPTYENSMVPVLYFYVSSNIIVLTLKWNSFTRFFIYVRNKKYVLIIKNDMIMDLWQRIELS